VKRVLGGGYLRQTDAVRLESAVGFIGTNERVPHLFIMMASAALDPSSCRSIRVDMRSDQMKPDRGGDVFFGIRCPHLPKGLVHHHSQLL